MMNVRVNVIAVQGFFTAFQARFMGFFRDAINPSPSGNR